MRVSGMGVSGMMMIMVVMVVMVMPVVVVVMICRLQSAHAGTERVTEPTVSHVGARRICPLPFDMVVVAFLYGAHLTFETQNGGAVFAQHAGRGWYGTKGGMCAVLGTDVMMCAFFKRENLTAVATNAAVGWRRVADLFHDPFGKGLKHFGMITQIARLDELNIRVLSSNLVGKAIDPVNQNA